MDKEKIEAVKEDEIVEDENKVDDATDSEKEEKIFKQEDVNSIVKSRIDRATKDMQKKIDELTKKIALQSLSEKDKQDYESKLKDEELERLKGELLKHQLCDVAKNQLTQKGIMPTDDILDIVIGIDEDSTIEKTEALINLIETQTNEKIKKTAREKTPTTGIKTTVESERFNVAEFTRKNRKI